MEINIQEKLSLGRMEFGLKCVNYFLMTRLYVLNTLRIVVPFRLMILPLTGTLMMYICGLGRIYILCNTLLEEASFITKWSFSKALNIVQKLKKQINGERQKKWIKFLLGRVNPFKRLFPIFNVNADGQCMIVTQSAIGQKVA